MSMYINNQQVPALIKIYKIQILVSIGVFHDPFRGHPGPLIAEFVVFSQIIRKIKLFEGVRYNIFEGYYYHMYIPCFRLRNSKICIYTKKYTSNFYKQILGSIEGVSGLGKVNKNKSVLLQVIESKSVIEILLQLKTFEFLISESTEKENFLLCKINLVLFGDVQPSSRPEVIH